MRNLVIDIETIVDPDNPSFDKKGKKVDFPAPIHWLVACIGGALLGGAQGLMLEKIGIFPGDELAAVQWLVSATERDTVRLVTWNGRGFDLPVLSAACFRLGIPWPWYYQPKDTRYRYSTKGHYDVMDDLSDMGASKSAKMDAAARAIGLPGKIDGVTGASVAELVAAGRIDEVRTYCLWDVAQETALFLRASLVRGDCSAQLYQEAILQWRLVCHENPETRVVVEKTDWDKLSRCWSGP